MASADVLPASAGTVLPQFDSLAGRILLKDFAAALPSLVIGQAANRPCSAHRMRFSTQESWNRSVAVGVSKSSDRDRDSTPAYCRPSITRSPHVSPVSGGAKVDRVGGRSLTAMMCLCHPGSGLTLSMTGPDAFQMICRLDPEIADTAPMAIGAVT